MKFRYGQPPLQKLDITDTVKAVMPSMNLMTGLALGAAVVLFGLTFSVLYVTGTWPMAVAALKHAAATQSLFVLLLMVVGVTILHELVHALFYPRAIRGGRCVLGILPSAGVAYAWTGEAMPRNRYIVAVAAPLLLLSVIPLIFFVGAPGQVGVGLIAILVNLIGSAGDVVLIGALLWRVPAGSWVQASGTTEYWGAQPSGSTRKTPSSVEEGV